MHRKTLPLLVTAILAVTSLQAADSSTDPEVVRITTERAEKIIARLGIADEEKADRVREIIARQYRDLSDIHAKRDASLKAISQLSADESRIETDKQSAKREAELEQFRLHYAFLAKLAVDLTPSQVDQVKDAITFNVVPITFDR